MSIRRRIKKIGGSVGVLIPRDLAEAMGVRDGSDVRMTLVGRQLVVEPEDSIALDDDFMRAFSAVLRRYGSSFESLARLDEGKS